MYQRHLKSLLLLSTLQAPELVCQTPKPGLPNSVYVYSHCVKHESVYAIQHGAIPSCVCSTVGDTGT